MTLLSLPLLLLPNRILFVRYFKAVFNINFGDFFEHFPLAISDAEPAPKALLLVLQLYVYVYTCIHTTEALMAIIIKQISSLTSP